MWIRSSEQQNHERVNKDLAVKPFFSCAVVSHSSGVLLILIFQKLQSLFIGCCAFISDSNEHLTPFCLMVGHKPGRPTNHLKFVAQNHIACI